MRSVMTSLVFFEGKGLILGYRLPGCFAQKDLMPKSCEQCWPVWPVGEVGSAIWGAAVIGTMES